MAIPQHILGIGGVFIYARDPRRVALWYQQLLGIPLGADKPETKGFYTALRYQLAQAPDVDTSVTFSVMGYGYKVQQPAQGQSVMINYLVRDLAAFIAHAASLGISPAQPQEDYDYGRFCWFTDPEGNMLEVYEPIGRLPD